MEIISSVLNKEFEISKSGNYGICIDKNSTFLTLTIKSDLDVTLDLKSLNDLSNLVIEVEENSNCILRGLFEETKKAIDLQVFLAENSHFNAYFSDFTNGDTVLKSITNLNGKGARANFHLTTLAKENNKKKFNISFEHNVGKTYSNIEGFAVSRDTGFVTINGVSHVVENAIKSEAHQKVKGILINETSRAIANPILKIDCDDIIASHACAIGSLNTDHIFYLLSRGLSIEEARRLITIGYLLPIKEFFGDEEKEKIQNYVEGDF